MASLDGDLPGDDGWVVKAAGWDSRSLQVGKSRHRQCVEQEKDISSSISLLVLSHPAELGPWAPFPAPQGWDTGMAPGILMGASCTSQAANALGERPSLDPSWER